MITAGYVAGRQRNAPRRQCGAATLLFGLLLLMGAAVLSFTTARTGVMEQRIANNEVRTIEAQQAAQAGLEYALAWLGKNHWDTGDATPTPPVLTDVNGFSYSSSLAFSETSGYIEARATSQATTDASITAKAAQYVQQNTLLSGPGAAADPLVVDGCMGGGPGGITGNPDVFPENWNGGSPGVAIATSQDSSCIDEGHMNLHGGSIRDNAFSGETWEHLFDISKAEFQALAANNTSSDHGFHWITSSANWHADMGSPSQPAFLAFDASAGCVKFNGNPTIYGIIYFEDGSGCLSQGWGGATVYGTVAFEGGLDKFNANTELYHWSEGNGSDDDFNPVLSATRIPGTWRDW